MRSSSGDMLLFVLSARLMLNVQTARLSVDGVVISGASGQTSSGYIGRASHEYNAASAAVVINILFIFSWFIHPYKRVSTRMPQD